MYRFSSEKENWIVRFSPQLQVEDLEKDMIVRTLLLLKDKILSYSHGDSFIIKDQGNGIVVFQVERIPSFIITVTAIVPQDKWFVQDAHGTRKMK
ncbi:hypothetical protein [Bacillus massilinigeriensis]|uniref:hypothetical protein n=1 Tax=Bacillus mediterraneensis TaxID=1805474 RepID=UPI0008F913E3|nr:hypothetical protein [Bacillus mediterraneensis]